ncbi:MAG: hypothetical protein AAB581_03135 [Patescibacteria group bacterium]
MRCVLCPRDLYREHERVIFERKGKKVKAHLNCYILYLLVQISSHTEVNLSDPVHVDPDGICNWCRQNVPVISMMRSGQSVCLQDLHHLTEILSRWYRINIGMFIRANLTKDVALALKLERGDPS